MARIEIISYVSLAFCALAIVLVPMIVRHVQSVVIAGPKPVTVGYSLFPETILFELAEEWGLLSFVGARFARAPWDELHKSLLRSNHSNTPAYDIIYSNRKTAMWLGGANYGAKVLQDSRDLVVYNAFAIMYWPTNKKLHEFRAAPTTMPGFSGPQRVSAALAQLNGATVLASGDTDHALSLENLIRERGLRNVTVERNGSPNEMLRRFLRQKNAMYVGGASQRIIAEAAGARALTRFTRWLPSIENATN